MSKTDEQRLEANDTALIEAIEKLSANLWVITSAAGGTAASFKTDDLKSLVSRLEAAEKERDERGTTIRNLTFAASQVTFALGKEYPNLMRKLQEQIDMARKSLKGESNDG